MRPASTLSSGTATTPSLVYILRPSNAGVVSSIAALDARERAERNTGLSRRVHGVFASVRNDRPVPWATREQRDLMALLEVDPAVLGYEPTPERVRYVTDGRTCEHVPAFRVRTRRGDAILDTFPGARSEARQRLVAILTEVYADRGIPYRAMSGADIRIEPRFGNARHILAHRGYRPSGDDELLLESILSLGGPRTLDEIRAALPDMEAEATACAMALRGHLVLDLSAKTPGGMTVSLLKEHGR